MPPVGAGEAAGIAAGAAAGKGAGAGAAAGAPLSAFAGAAAGEGAAPSFALALALLSAVMALPLSLEFGSLAALAGANDTSIAPSANKPAACRDTFDNLIVASALHPYKINRNRFWEHFGRMHAAGTRHTRVTRDSCNPHSGAARAPPQKHPKNRAPNAGAL